MPDEEKKRFPAVDRKISQIRDEDGRVRVLCTAVKGSGNEVTVDDGTGQLRVAFSSPEDARKALGWGAVRIFGRPSGGLLHGEIVQDMRKLNIALYRKIVG
jgi:hypothetical protein